MKLQFIDNENIVENNEAWIVDVSYNNFRMTVSKVILLIPAGFYTPR